MKVLFARLLATYWHWKADNRRKYTNDPYIVHPKEVVKILNGLLVDSNMLCAAWLHDAVEDAGVKLSTIRFLFGEDVAQLVDDLTDKTTLGDGNRAKRVAINNERLSKISSRAQTVKYADLISNTKSIVKHDPRFAVIYLKEKEEALRVMDKGHVYLRETARNQILKGLKRLDSLNYKK